MSDLTRSIQKDDYKKLFNVKASYDFPTLKTDDDGIFTCEIDEYDIFDKFQLTDKGQFSHLESKSPDLEIERFIIGNKIKQIRIHLVQNLKGEYSNHDCYVYPKIIATNSAVYDTLYLTDYLLKHIYRILMCILVYGSDPEFIARETYMISMREIGGEYKVVNVECHYGFLRLIEMISDFVKDNNLREKQPQINREYLEFKKLNTLMSASISYRDIRYTLEDRTNILQFKKLREKIDITCPKGGEIPPFAVYFQKFFEQYYDDIKKVFPIYNRLENIYRLCALNVVLDNFTPEKELHNTVYIDTFPRSILLSGGFELTPTNFVRIPYKEHPIIVQTQKNIDLKECKKPFDNGGIICAFAPKLQIKNCYDKNLKEFHECLK